jgi:hypothetical protein
MKHLRRHIATLAAVLLLVGAVGIFGFQTSAKAATRVGGVDVERHCQWAWGYHAYVAYWSAFGWRCNPVPNNAYYKILDKNVDMNAACRLQYGNNVWASYSDSRNPYSWSCYR